jgi:hypothetical protein
MMLKVLIESNDKYKSILKLPDVKILVIKCIELICTYDKSDNT